MLARDPSSGTDVASSNVEDRQSCLSPLAPDTLDRQDCLSSTYLRNTRILFCASSHVDPATFSGFSIF